MPRAPLPLLFTILLERVRASMSDIHGRLVPGKVAVCIGPGAGIRVGMGASSSEGGVTAVQPGGYH